MFHDFMGNILFIITFVKPLYQSMKTESCHDANLINKVVIITTLSFQGSNEVVPTTLCYDCGFWQLWCPEARGLFYLHGLTLIPAWISNHAPCKVWDEITYPFLNFNGCTVEV